MRETPASWSSVQERSQSWELREKSPGWDDARIATREAIRLREGQIGHHLKAVLGANLIAEMG